MIQSKKMELNVLNGGIYMNTFKLGLLCALSVLSTTIFGMNTLINKIVHAQDKRGQIDAYENIIKAIPVATDEELTLLDDHYKTGYVTLGYCGQDLKNILVDETIIMQSRVKSNMAAEKVEESKQAASKRVTSSVNQELAKFIKDTVISIESANANSERQLAGLRGVVASRTGLVAAVEARHEADQIAMAALYAEITEARQQNSEREIQVKLLREALEKIASPKKK